MVKLYNFISQVKQVLHLTTPPPDIAKLQDRLRLLEQAENMAQLLLSRHNDHKLEQKLYQIQEAKLVVAQQLHALVELVSEDNPVIAPRSFA